VLKRALPADMRPPPEVGIEDDVSWDAAVLCLRDPIDLHTLGVPGTRFKPLVLVAAGL